MVFTPNDPVGGPGRDPDLRTTPVDRRRSPWAIIIAVAVVLVAGFAFYSYMTPSTDPRTTASTTQNEVAPAPPPVQPTAPATNNGAVQPAAPPSGNP